VVDGIDRAGLRQGVLLTDADQQIVVPLRPVPAVWAATVRPVESVLAVDIGGTKLAAGVVDESGRIHARAQRPTPPGDEATVWSALAGVVDEARAALPDGVPAPLACGTGCGGPMTSGGEEVSPLNIRGWRDFPLRRRLAEHLELPVWIDNDAKALALGEGWLGGARGQRNYLAMVISTGVGGGLVLDGGLVDGAGGNAGHVGHMIVEPGGRVCGCGASGCLEAEASGSAIAAITGRPAAEAPASVRVRTGTLVGRAVASVANLCDLPLAVVAGSVALGFGDTFFTAAQDELDRSCRLAFSRGARIEPARLGADGPLVGAAAVGWRGLGSAAGGER
jgi:glucokinase